MNDCDNKLTQLEDKRRYERQEYIENDLISIDQDRFNDLVESQLFLTALESAGVDGWTGYQVAQDECYGDEE